LINFLKKANSMIENEIIDMPRITKISLTGFKSFKNKNEIQLHNLNVVIGANGAGKSNLLSFFQLLGNALTSNLQGHIMRYGGEHFLYNGRKNTDRIKCEIEMATKNAIDIYALDLSFQAPGRLFISREYLEYRKKGEPKPFTIEIENNGYELGILNVNDKDKNYTPAIRAVAVAIKNMLQKIRAFQFHDTTDTARIRGGISKADCQYLKANGGNLAAVLNMLKTTEAYVPYYKRIVKYVQKILPYFEDFELTGYPENPNEIYLNWKKQTSEYILTPNQLSDGTIRFIALATLLLAPREIQPSVVVIDEPELGLHPMAIHILSSMIKQAAENIQIIIATQSPTLLDMFDAKNILVVEAPRDSTTVKRLDDKMLAEWLDQYTLSELWDKNVLGGQP